MKINDLFKRKDTVTSKWSELKTIQTQKELEYHRDLQSNGIDYLIIHKPETTEDCVACSA